MFRGLHEAEQRFGNRDNHFEIELLIAWRDEGPCISFPEKNKVQIYVSNINKKGDTHVRWDIAHECVHLIDPYKVVEGRATNNLEEGLATWFQNSKIHLQSPWSPWAEAERWVKCAGIERLCSIVHRLRSEEVRIGDITAKQLETKGVEAGIAHELGKRFVRSP